MLTKLSVPCDKEVSSFAGFLTITREVSLGASQPVAISIRKGKSIDRACMVQKLIRPLIERA